MVWCPGMNNNLLLVAWPYQGSIKFSTRVAVNYTPPTVISGPTVTAISSSVTATHWKWTFRCQDCTSWIAQGILGAIVQDSISVFGWA
ncbi:hypothetical protein FRC03_001195 [Tulasnella sp. 419]|nr:hypothetical protein FRC03_001195 [Tulasnella sp. 419]